MSTYGERLKSERLRLGLNQTEMAGYGGVKKLAQINYEKGERRPDANYLMGIATIGADTDYILSGVRANPTSRELAEIELLLENNPVDTETIATQLNVLRATATDIQKGRIDLLLDLLGDKKAIKRRMETIDQVGERLKSAKEIAASVIASADWNPPTMVVAILETAIFEGLGHRGSETILEMLKTLVRNKTMPEESLSLNDREKVKVNIVNPVGVKKTSDALGISKIKRGQVNEN